MKASFFCTGDEKHGSAAYQRVMTAMDIEASRHGLIFYQPILHPDDMYHCHIIIDTAVHACASEAVALAGFIKSSEMPMHHGIYSVLIKKKESNNV